MMSELMLVKVERYLSQRRGLGYRLQTEGRLLAQFAQYWDNLGLQGPVTAMVALDWARLSANAAPLYQARRLEVVRCFTRYLAALEPGTEIPPPGLLGPAHRRVQPHIYNNGEVQALLAACRELSPKDGLRPQTYATFLGLLAAAGLRTGEALRLARDDVDWDRELLLIRETKYRKSRLVPLHPTSIQALRDYACRREQLCPFPLDRTFFLSDRGRALPMSMVHATFRVLRRRLGWVAGETGRWPRIYDLRHTFACRRLILWQQQNAAAGQRLPALSTYLGHGKLADTYWYLSGVPELFNVVGEMFERYAHSGERP